MSDDAKREALLDGPLSDAPTIPGGRYEIRGFLGSGGFAKVYEGYDTLIHRPVAIKVMSPISGAANAKAAEVLLERFNREARTAASIRHASVVAIYDMGVLDTQQPFIVMEKLDGHDLEEELELNGGMAPRRILPLFCKALDALGEGHRQGIIHKDLKPSNLFLTAPDTDREDIRVVDFGIARIADANVNLTSTGQIFGTPRYIAPEYADTQAATPAVDVYQMGLILVELLTGRPVVDTENAMRCLMIHATGKLEVPDPVLTGPLGPAISRAIMRDPTERFEDAIAFKSALEIVNLDTLPKSYAIEAHTHQGPSSADLGPPMTTPVHGMDTEGRSVPPEKPRKPRVGPTEPLAPSETVPPKAGGSSLLRGGVIAAVLLVVGAVLLTVVGGVVYTMITDHPAPPVDDGQAAKVKKVKKAKKDAPQKPKALVLRSEPSKATVFEDGKRVGKTPFEVEFETSDDKPRTFEIRKDGHQTAEITLEPDDKAPKAIRLEREAVPLEKAGRVVVLNSEPSGASVLLGTEVLGVTPLELEFDPDDPPLSLKLTLRGHVARRVTVTPSKGEEETIVLKKVPRKPSTPRVDTSPDPSPVVF